MDAPGGARWLASLARSAARNPRAAVATVRYPSFFFDEFAPAAAAASCVATPPCTASASPPSSSSSSSNGFAPVLTVDASVL